MKRWIAALLAAVLCVSASVGLASAASAPSVLILAAQADRQTLTVTYRLTDPVPGQQITCLVQGANGELLQVSQTAQEQSGVHTLTLTLAQAPDGFTVRLGGTDVDAYRTVTCPPGSAVYAAPAVGFSVGQTAQQVMDTLQGMSDLSVLRADVPLPPTETILPGDTVKGVLPDGRPAAFTAVVFGDLDFDGRVTAADALLTLRHAVGKIRLEETALLAADFRQTGTVNATTALDLLKVAVGKIAAL